MSLAKNWIFTINNPTEEDLPSLWEHVKAFKYQLEVGEEGTPHYQGVVQFTKRMRLAGLKKLNGRAHWEVCYSIKGSVKYCGKEEGRLEEPILFGEFSYPGDRSDLKRSRRLIEEGTSTEDLWDKCYSTMVRYERSIMKYKRLKTKPRSWYTDIVVYWGSTRIGKTQAVMDKYPTAYWQDGSKWFDDYDGQATVIIDDFYGNMHPSMLLKLANHCPHKVEVKHGYVPFVAKLLVITCNKHPHEWYGSSVPTVVKLAIYRRITHLWTRDSFNDPWENIVQYL